MLRLYDAHNHLQDARLRQYGPELLDAARREGIVRMVVNGSCEQDWPDVLALARAYPEVLPSFGCHPWHVKDRTEHWQQKLLDHLDQGTCGIGEIGLDRWFKDSDITAQEEVFTWQLRLGAARDLPVSIHCLQAWGLLLDLLRHHPRPARGFLLHSYGGPREMIEPFTRLGAYFSLPGYFANTNKERQREVFRHVPPERLLIETDAPDQRLPPDRVVHPLLDAGTGSPINHPANLRAVYTFAAELLREPLDEVALRVEQNFLRLFAPPVS